MIVSEIYADVRQITTLSDEAQNLSRISDAIEVICNRGNYDSLLGYLTIKAQGNIITLPPDVEVPLRVNLNSNPSFTRDQVYEFTMNGPGQDEPRIGWSWEDRGITPTMKQIIAPGQLSVSGFAVDAGKTITVKGRINKAGSIDSTTFTLGTLEGPSPQTFFTVESVVKDPTDKQVSLTIGGAALSVYGPEETFPQYRQIRISKPNAFVYILFKRNRTRVTSQDDFIPIRSKMGILYMVKAIQQYRAERPDLAQPLEQTAMQLVNDEQKSHNAQLEIAGSLEQATVRNLSYNNIDSIIVSDIYDEACQILGPVGEDAVFDSITEAISILGRKGQWDSLRGYVDITTQQYEYFTLPRYVEDVIEVNINHIQAPMLNKWFQFHLDGPGEQWFPCHHYEDAGEVVTLRDQLFPVKLAAIPDIESDSSTEIRVFGYRNGKWIQTINADGIMEDGFVVPCSTSGDFGTQSVFVDRIERITKTKSAGYIKLLGRDSNDDNEYTVGYYFPDETEPRYRRIRVFPTCGTIRIMYRKRQLKISSLSDPIHLKSKSAVLTMVQALVALKKGDVQNAELLETKATKFLREEYRINNQSEVLKVEFGDNHYSDQFIAC